MNIKERKKKYKALIGADVIEKRSNREGKLEKIGYANKDYTVIYFLFRHAKGAYLVRVSDVEVKNK